MEFFKILFISILIIIGGYIIFRLFSKAIYESYFEAKNKYKNKHEKGENDGKI